MSQELTDADYLRAIAAHYDVHTVPIEFAEHAKRLRAIAKRLVGMRTGWPEGMLQDDSRELSRALASWDVEVAFGTVRNRLHNLSYGLRLICTRVGGWELWNHWDSHRGVEPELIASDSGDLRVWVKGTLICGKDEPQTTNDDLGTSAGIARMDAEKATVEEAMWLADQYAKEVLRVFRGSEAHQIEECNLEDVALSSRKLLMKHIESMVRKLVQPL